MCKGTQFFRFLLEDPTGPPFTCWQIEDATGGSDSSLAKNIRPHLQIFAQKPRDMLKTRRKDWFEFK